jgi:DNA-binding response OmpR family regulator
MESKTKILVVEDEQGIRENMQEMLEARGFVVRAATNGKQGVLEAIDFRPNLILCDIMMPKMDGYQVLEQIRKTSNIQNVPFIFLTAKVDKNDIRMGMTMGADDYLTKPFTAKELVGAVDARLKRQEKYNNLPARAKHEIDTSVFATYYHEFNTPLHGIVGGLNLLINAGKSFSEKQTADLLFSVLKSSLRLNHTLSNLMLYEEIKRAEAHPELVTMFNSGQTGNFWAQKIKDELQTIAKEMYGRAADLQVEFVDVTELNINFEYLLRMMIEVTDNALKFSKSGQKVSVTGKQSGENYVFEITDNGSGFSFNGINDIAPFKQFFKRKFEQQGMGMGLFLVKKLIQFNSGDLVIQTIEDKGTKVTVSLPLMEGM